MILTYEISDLDLFNVKKNFIEKKSLFNRILVPLPYVIKFKNISTEENFTLQFAIHI